MVGWPWWLAVSVCGAVLGIGSLEPVVSGSADLFVVALVLVVGDGISHQSGHGERAARLGRDTLPGRGRDLRERGPRWKVPHALPTQEPRWASLRWDRSMSPHSSKSFTISSRSRSSSPWIGRPLQRASSSRPAARRWDRAAPVAGRCPAPHKRSRGSSLLRRHRRSALTARPWRPHRRGRGQDRSSPARFPPQRPPRRVSPYANERSPSDPRPPPRGGIGLGDLPGQHPHPQVALLLCCEQSLRLAVLFAFATDGDQLGSVIFMTSTPAEVLDPSERFGVTADRFPRRIRWHRVSHGDVFRCAAARGGTARGR